MKFVPFPKLVYFGHLHRGKWSFSTFGATFRQGEGKVMSEAGKKPDEAVKWSENLNNYVIKYLIIMSKYRTVFQGMFGEEKVVIKVSRLTKRPTDKIYLQRELEFLRSANHPNIRDFCPIKEPSLAETHSFYASTHAYELPVLLDLRREEIGKKDDSDSDEVELPLSEKCVQQMANQIISGLSYLHKQGFLHSRLRKDYITLSEDGTVKLIGFARMALIDEDDDQVDIRNGFTGETYEIEDESFFLGLLCVELLLDESPFDPDVLFGRPTSRRLRQYQQEYKAMKKRRIFSLPAIFPDGDPDKMEKLERNLSLEGRSFLEKTIFSSKDSRPTCEQLKEHVWIKGKDGVDVIVDELVHRGATERADYILRRENAVMWFESMKLGNGRILISILGSIYSKPSSHLYLPFTAPMPMEHNMAEVRQIVEYNLLQMLGLAITNVQFFHLVEKIMEKMDIVSRVPYVVLREVIGFPTGDKTDVVNGLTDCVMVFVTKDKYEFHQFLKTNWPKVYRLYSDKFYGHESMATDIEHLNKAFPRYDSLPTRIVKSEEKVETAAAVQVADGAENASESKSASIIQPLSDPPTNSAANTPRTSTSSCSTANGFDIPFANSGSSDEAKRARSTTPPTASLENLAASSTNSSTNPPRSSTSSTNSSVNYPSDIHPLPAPVESHAKTPKADISSTSSKGSRSSKSSGRWKFIPSPLEDLARSVGSKIGKGLERLRRDSSQSDN